MNLSLVVVLHDAAVCFAAAACLFFQACCITTCPAGWLHMFHAHLLTLLPHSMMRLPCRPASRTPIFSSQTGPASAAWASAIRSTSPSGQTSAQCCRQGRMAQGRGAAHCRHMGSSWRRSVTRSMSSCAAWWRRWWWEQGPAGS
jgi:hypothetical protein